MKLYIVFGWKNEKKSKVSKEFFHQYSSTAIFYEAAESISICKTMEQRWNFCSFHITSGIKGPFLYTE